MCKRSRTHRKGVAFDKYLWMFAIAAALVACFGCGVMFASAKPADYADVERNTDPPVTLSESPDNFSGNDVWNLVLVNPWNPIPEDYSAELTQLRNNQAVDERCYPALQDMMDACRAAGLSPLICSSYRTQEDQEILYNNQVDQLVERGDTRAEAKAKAGTEVAVPGTSEHQTGLAVDIVDLNYQVLDQAQEETDVQKWLMEHCWEYGFILRYPESKSELTGIIYEPWHYRYVGQEAAKEIAEKELCLEEYLSDLTLLTQRRP